MDKFGNFIQYNLFKQFKNLVAFTTTKQIFNIRNPRFTGNLPEIHRLPRRLLAEMLGIKTEKLIFPRQEHTNCVVELDHIPDDELKATDALITDKTGICLCVQTADCVPILLFDPVKKVIAVVHAGWRGTVKKIVTLTVELMISNYHSNPKDILAVTGPSISPDVYEVGNEVVDAVRKEIPKPEKTLHLNLSGKYHFNLWEANRQLLLKVGISDQNIEIFGECSFTKSDTYFSARRDGTDTGRMVSGIMIL